MARIFERRKPSGSPKTINLTGLKSTRASKKPKSNKFKRTLATIFLAASMTLPGTKAIKSHYAAKEKARVEHVQKIKSMGLNEKSADVSRIYTKMTPVTIRAIEGVCKKVGTTPNRFMFSIESYKNEIRETKNGLKFSNEIIDSLRNSAMHSGGNSTEGGRRRLRIVQAMIEFGELPESMKKNLIESTNKHGSLRELRDAIRKEGKK